MIVNKKYTNKGEIQRHLAKKKFLSPDSPGIYHGRVYKSFPPPPACVWESKEKPRQDQDAPDWLTASEYQDSTSSLGDKVERLAGLISLSKLTVVYTGAGISTSAGVGQAARGAGDKASGSSSTDAKPSLAHLALTALKERGLVHSWIQQNHDGLPQKAGWPQEDIIEIHGSWYDPSNPVVCYDGNLRQDLYQKIKDLEEKADLVIVIGTTLSGLNSDGVAARPARRSLAGKSLGTVIINLQQTRLDGESTLRIFEKADTVMEGLLTKLGVPLINCPVIHNPEYKVLVPYDKNGNKTEERLMWLDLSKGQKIRLHPSHNCQDSQQPLYQHIGAKVPTTYRGRVRQPGAGEGTVVRFSNKNCGWDLVVEGVAMLLGGWWLQAAARGQLDTIPVINVNPEYQDRAAGLVEKSEPLLARWER